MGSGLMCVVLLCIVPRIPVRGSRGLPRSLSFQMAGRWLYNDFPGFCPPLRPSLHHVSSAGTMNGALGGALTRKLVSFHRLYCVIAAAFHPRGRECAALLR